MTDYEIKIYQPGFENEQEKIGREVAKTFLIPHQTPATRLKEVYTAEDFDPETRLYAFKGEKMIGFLTSRVLPIGDDGIQRANLTPPSVLTGYEDAEKILFKKVIAILKNKGVQKVLSNYGAFANKSKKDAENLGYKLVNEAYFLYNVNLDDIDSSISLDNIIAFDYDKHQEMCAKILADEYGRDIDWANNFYERIRNDTTINRMQFVIVENNELKGYLGLNQNNIVPTIASIMVIYAANADYMKQLLAKIASIKNELSLKQIHAAYSDISDIKLEKYKPMKFEFLGSSAQFELTL
ncbi:MAG: hypothetical protein FK734_21170 [Asgard group archaeon]|nr:hypothetical protein [Asgard group archaeon]